MPFTTLRDPTKVALSWPNRVSEVNLSGGDWLTSLPINNVKNRILAKRARSVDLDPSSTQFVAEFPARPRPIAVVAIAAHNLSPEARWQFKVYGQNSAVIPEYDSGLMNVWQPIYSTFDLEWEYDNWWSGVPEEDQLNVFTPIAFQIFQLVVADKIEIFIEDGLNPDDYVEVGRAYFGAIFQPNINASFGASFGIEQSTTIETALDDTEYFDRRRPRRTMSMSLERLTEEEAFGQLQTMQREVGIDQELFVSFDQVGDYTYQKSFLGRLQQTDPITQPYIDYFTNSINIIEII